MRSHFQANPPNAPCPPGASNPDRVSITSPSLSPAQPLLIQNSTETPTSGTPPLSAPPPAPSPWPGTRSLRQQPFPRSTGLYQPVTLARPCASQTLGLDCVPDSVSPVSQGRVSWLAPHTPCTGPCPTVSVGLGPAAWWTRVRPKGPCHSLEGGKQAVLSPTTHGFLHQSGVRSPHSWHKACTPGDSLKERTDWQQPLCCSPAPDRSWRLGLEGAASSGSWRRPRRTRRKQPGAGSPGAGCGAVGAGLGACVLAEAWPPSRVCLAVSVTVSVLLSVSRQLGLGGSAYGHPANLCSFPLLTLLSEITPRTAPLVMPPPTRPVQRGRGRGHCVSI